MMSEQTPEQQSQQTEEVDNQGYDSLKLAGRHVPLEGSGPFKHMGEAHAAGHDTLNPVTGTYEIGVLVDGAFVPIFEESAGRFFHLVEAAKAAQQQQDGSQGQ